jgi:hypothetical protein
MLTAAAPSIHAQFLSQQFTLSAHGEPASLRAWGEKAMPNRIDIIGRANAAPGSGAANPIDALLAATASGMNGEEATGAEAASDMSADSLGVAPAATKRRLLPENMSVMERILWGESGFFRWTGIADTLSPKERKHELDVRRFMLSAHQIGGFATFAAMVAGVYYGQKTIDGDFAAGRTHSSIIKTTILMYTATGLLALLTPPPLIRRDEANTVTTHKLLAWAHIAGMIVTPILASYISKRNPSSSSAHIHQISGYLTTAIFGASLVTVTF